MPYLTLGASTELQIKVPTNGTTDWGDTLKTDTFQKIAEHDHTGSGKGKQLGQGSIQANAINGVRFRLDNDEYLRARNAADSADVNILKLNTSDKLEVAPLITVLRLDNDVNLVARNNADNADVDLLKLNTSDQLVIGPTIVAATITTLTSPTINATQANAQGSVTLADNTASASDASVITLSADETCKIEGKITRNGAVRRVTLELDQDNANIIESGHGDSVGVTFSIASDQLQYTTTSTGFDATFTYTIIKE
jgi:hypothetical protein